jgi:uracil-DNA glycosylase family 4
VTTEEIAVERLHPKAECESCPLRDAGSFVPSYGPSTASIAFVGEAAGQSEVQEGRPFVGVSGKLLGEVLRHHGMTIHNVFLTNATLCRPRGKENTAPPPAAIKACRPRLVAELEERDIKKVVALGNVATHTLLNTTIGVTEMRVGLGKKSPVIDAEVFPTFHPAYCVNASTRLLGTDLNWKEAGSIVVGDELIGFDEFVPTTGSYSRRGFKSTHVTDVHRYLLPSYKITTAKGVLICSADHQWLVQESKEYYTKTRWKRTEDLLGTDRLLHFIDPWVYDRSREAGYLAGFLDGEGHVATPNGLGWGQNDGPVAGRVKRGMEERGFRVSTTRETKCKLYGVQGKHESIRALGILRPERLLPKAKLLWEGPRNTKQVPIQSIEFLGEQEVVAITTTEHTFIAEGFLSHNCLRNADGFPSLVKDVGKLVAEQKPWTPPTYKVFDDPAEAIVVLDELRLRTEYNRLVVDIECNIEKDSAFDHPNHYEMLCVGIAYAKGKVIVIERNALKHEGVKTAMRDLFMCKELGAQNGKFDLAGLFPLVGVVLKLSLDSMLMSYCLDERRGIHSLGTQGVEILGTPDWKHALDKWNPKRNGYGVIPADVLDQYNAYDCSITWDLIEYYLPLLEEKDLRKLHDHLVKASNELIYCFVPGTRILTRDLRWKSVEDLIEGEELVAVDEKDIYQMQPGKVVATGRAFKKCYEIVTEKGTLTCSWDHKWPVKSTSKTHSPVIWKTAKEIFESKSKWELFHFVDPWEEDNSREAGYLAGIYDGEGCLSYANGGRNRILTFNQKRGKVLKEATDLLQAKGFNPLTHYGPDDKVDTVYLTDRRKILRALGQLRPVRLLAKSDEVWVGRRQYRRVPIQEIRYVGEKEVISLETDTRTYIAEGFVTHNTELNGIGVDKKHNTALATKYLANLARVEESIQSILDAAHGEFALPDFNPRSWMQVKKALELWDVYVKSTDEKTLRALLEKQKDPTAPLADFLSTLLTQRREQKLYSTYVKGLRERVYRGRVYPTFLLHGTTTGRLSCRNPNLQNIPRESIIRDQFVPVKQGNVFVQTDMSQAELRVLTWLAQEEYFRGIFNDSTRDLFNELTPRLYGDVSHLTPAQRKELRIRVKAYVYGLSYGREAMSIAQEFKITFEEAQRGLDTFFSVIPNVVKYQTEVKQQIRQGRDLITPFGRHRRFHLLTASNVRDAEKEALAFRPQSISSDIALQAFYIARPKLKGKAHFRNIVHDSILAECKEEDAEMVSYELDKAFLESAYTVVGDYVQFATETKVGLTWGEV